MDDDPEFAMLDALGLPIAVLDQAGSTLYRTPDWSRLHGDLLARARDIIARSPRGEPVGFTGRVADRWVDIAVRPLIGSRWIVVARDDDERVRAAEEVKRLRLRVLTVQEDERRSISQNLHDELGQGMTALAMKVASIADAATDPQTGAALGEVRSLVEVITKRMRQLFYRIRPPGLHDESLAIALADYCTASAHSTGLTIRFDAADDLPPLGGAEATALYRLLQEAVTNVAKHAGAGSVWVSLTADRDAVSLSVEDDGAGFDPRSRGPGIGIPGLRERFAMLEGELVVDSKVGSGTRLIGSVPRLATGTGG